MEEKMNKGGKSQTKIKRKNILKIKEKIQKNAKK